MITKEVLQNLYYNQNLTIRQIAKHFDCAYNNIHYRFKKFGLETRKPSGNRQIKGSKFKELNDREWLHQKYVVENWSTIKIGKLLGCNTNTVRQSLKRLGFKIRNMRDAQVWKSENRKLIMDINLINGIMLGDGHMRIGKTDVSMPYIEHTSKHREYSEHISMQLFDEIKVKHSKNKQAYKNKESIFNSYIVRSLSDEKLKSIYKKWYKNKIKIIPNDLVITPKTLLYWFMDDGSSYQRRKQSKIKQVYVILCTECFTKQENEFLADQLLKLGLKANIKSIRWGNGYRLEISQGQYHNFIDIIGPPPIECFKYKWK